MEKISNYIKAHPWATGIIVVVGGFIFLSLTGIIGGSGGSGSSGSSGSGPSDAEIAANATIQAAQIQAQAQAAAAGAAIQQAQIGAGVQMHSDDLKAQTDMRSLDVQQALGLAQISGQVESQRINADKDIAIQQSIASVYKTTNASNNKAKTSGGIIGAVSGLLGGIFSDQRLKENIRYVGTNARGVRIYEWNYKGSQHTRRGPIAQDLAREHPEMITLDLGSGYYKVPGSLSFN